MGTKKKKVERQSARWVSRIGAVHRAVSYAGPVLLVVFGYVAWHRWGAEHVNRKYNSLNVEQISISPTPEYIESDIVDSVFRSTDLTRVSLVDVHATAQIANAFATNAWVKSVLRVQKTAQGRVRVDVDYRYPVALVKVVSRHPEVQGMAFFAVDGIGVVLPTDDFSDVKPEKYIHIVIDDAYPIGGAGAQFGDDRVRDSAKLALLLERYRDQIGIDTISVGPSASHRDRYTLVLGLKNGREVVWGSAPGKEAANEQSAAAKLKLLMVDPTVSNLELHVAENGLQSPTY